MKSRGETAAPVETAHRSASACHVGAIAAAVGGGGLEFDPAAEKFTGGDAAASANRLLMRPMRGEWKF